MESRGYRGKARSSQGRTRPRDRVASVDPRLCSLGKGGSSPRFGGDGGNLSEGPSGSSGGSVGRGPMLGRPSLSRVARSTSNWTSSDCDGRVASRSYRGARDGHFTGDSNVSAIYPSNCQFGSDGHPPKGFEPACDSLSPHPTFCAMLLLARETFGAPLRRLVALPGSFDVDAPGSSRSHGICDLGLPGTWRVGVSEQSPAPHREQTARFAGCASDRPPGRRGGRGPDVAREVAPKAHRSSRP